MLFADAISDGQWFVAPPWAVQCMHTLAAQFPMHAHSPAPLRHSLHTDTQRRIADMGAWSGWRGLLVLQLTAQNSIALLPIARSGALQQFEII